MKRLFLYRFLTCSVASFGVVLAVSLTTPGLAYAADGSEPERIISGSGVSGISTQVRQLAKAQLTELSESEKRDRLRQLLSWSPAALQTSFTQLLESFTDEEIVRLLEIIDDSLMARGRLMEGVALQEQGTPEYERYMQRLATYPPAVSRVQRLERLVSATRVAEWLIRAQTSVSDTLELELSQGYEADTRDAVLNFMLYAYRRVSNAEIDALIRLWNDPVMQRWLTEAFAALPDPAPPEPAEAGLI
jgi:hypothetical protein